MKINLVSKNSSKFSNWDYVPICFQVNYLILRFTLASWHMSDLPIQRLILWIFLISCGCFNKQSNILNYLKIATETFFWLLPIGVSALLSSSLFLDLCLVSFSHIPNHSTYSLFSNLRNIVMSTKFLKI